MQRASSTPGPSPRPSSPAAEWTRGAFTITCDPARQDLDVIHGFLTECYWAKGIPRETVARSIAGALCFAIRHREEGQADRQVGFARVISDGATIAYIGDVFVLPDFRGQGLSKWLMDCIVSHPDLQGLRRWILVTSDAHGLYQQYGFTPLKRPDFYMERHDPHVYTRG